MYIIAQKAPHTVEFSGKILMIYSWMNTFMYQHGHGLARSTLKPGDLVNKVRLGDAAAESEFVNRYSRSLLLLLRNRIQEDEFAVNECAQEAFLVTLEKMRNGKIRKPEKITVFFKTDFNKHIYSLFSQAETLRCIGSGKRGFSSHTYECCRKRD